MSEIKYTVRIDMLRVLAWAVVREHDHNAILLHPVTLSTDPRENDGLYVPVTEDGRMNSVLNPMDVTAVIPATNTTQAWLVLQADGKDCSMPPHDTRVAHPAGFFTVGAANYDEQLAWLEKERARLEAECEEQFDWYFRHLEAMRSRAEREARGETVFP